MARRVILHGDTLAANALRVPALNQLAILKHQMKFQNLAQGERRLRFEDGVEYVCTSVFGNDHVHIYVPEAPPPEPEGVLVPVSPPEVFFFKIGNNLYWLICWEDGHFSIKPGIIERKESENPANNVIFIPDAWVGKDASSHNLVINTVAGSPSSDGGRVVISADTILSKRGRPVNTTGMPNIEGARDWLLKVDPHTNKQTIYWWKFVTHSVTIMLSGDVYHFWETAIDVVIVSPTWKRNITDGTWRVSFEESDHFSTVDYIYRGGTVYNLGSFPYYVQNDAPPYRFACRDYTGNPYHYIEGFESIDSKGAHVYKRPHDKWYWNFETGEGGQSWSGYDTANYLEYDNRGEEVELIITDGSGSGTFSTVSAEFTDTHIHTQSVNVAPWYDPVEDTWRKADNFEDWDEAKEEFTRLFAPDIDAINSLESISHNNFHQQGIRYYSRDGGSSEWGLEDTDYTINERKYFADEAVIYSYRESRGIYSFRGVWNIFAQKYDVTPVEDHDNYTGPYCVRTLWWPSPPNVQLDSCATMVLPYAGVFYDQCYVMLGDASEVNEVFIEGELSGGACTLDNREAPVDQDNVGILQVFKTEVASAETWNIYYNFIDITATVTSLLTELGLSISSITGFGMV